MLEVRLDDAHSVFIDLDDNDLVHRWIPVFDRATKNRTIDQSACFVFNISKSQALEQLKLAAQNINLFLKHPVVPQVEHNWDIDYCNQVHMAFEQLHGSFDEPTKLMMCAPDQIKQSIRDLNFYVHILEHDDYEQQNLWYINFSKDGMERLPLQDTDYDRFLDRMEPGMVFMHYADLGKTHAELYHDKLPANYKGLKNLHYLAADISIWLGNTVDYFRSGFRTWAADNSIDLSDPKLGLGILPLGRLRDLDTARELIYNAKNISQLRIHYG
jgi:hypothetical protein